ncbi:MAG: hypothetical protein AVDCRST_MAG45-995, partial [uncultured Solirubrobacterales bacterium]
DAGLRAPAAARRRAAGRPARRLAGRESPVRCPRPAAHAGARTVLGPRADGQADGEARHRRAGDPGDLGDPRRPPRPGRASARRADRAPLGHRRDPRGARPLRQRLRLRRRRQGQGHVPLPARRPDHVARRGVARPPRLQRVRARHLGLAAPGRRPLRSRGGRRGLARIPGGRADLVGLGGAVRPHHPARNLRRPRPRRDGDHRAARQAHGRGQPACRAERGRRLLRVLRAARAPAARPGARQPGRALRRRSADRPHARRPPATALDLRHAQHARGQRLACAGHDRRRRRDQAPRARGGGGGR